MKRMMFSVPANLLHLPPSSNTSGSGLVELVTDVKEIKIEEEIVEAQPVPLLASRPTLPFR